MIIHGLRGVGKTVLLNEFQNLAEAEGFLAYHHEMTPDRSLVADIAADATDALRQLDLAEKTRQRVRGALANLPTIRIRGPEGFDFSFEFRGVDEATVTRDLTRIFLELGAAAAERGRVRDGAAGIGTIQVGRHRKIPG